MSKSWEAGEQDTIKQWVLNAELTVSGESGGGRPLPSMGHGGFVVVPTPTAAAGRPGQGLSLQQSLFQPPLGLPGAGSAPWAALEAGAGPGAPEPG